jgi:hypothetical protein
MTQVSALYRPTASCFNVQQDYGSLQPRWTFQLVEHFSQGSGRAHAGIGQQRLANVIVPDNLHFSVICELLSPEEQHASSSEFVLSLVQLAPLQSALNDAGLVWR